ncbi:GNAT family N-acetyltransferase [Microvirga flavescens]|uniref:GNAT family N-acetyltransferase n=1 Tax=Microvirga flavescens TaxID=2249811 RepID=UPI000DDB430D|nr:GNAT family N-acetyltransferase [Microvirga flavescens]
MEPPSQKILASDDVILRAARPADCDDIAALSNLPGFRFGTLRLPHRSPEAIRKWLEGFTSDDFALVAVKAGRVVASGGLRLLQGRRGHVATLGMGVHDDYVGQGIGSKLLKELLTVADNWLGVRRVELTVYTDNAPAIALYKHNGFEVEGTHRSFAFRDGRYVDAHAMARLAA